MNFKKIILGIGLTLSVLVIGVIAYFLSNQKGSTNSVESGTILFSDDTIVTSENVSITGSTATITESGTYTIKGSSENGSVIVNTKGSVTLILSDLTLTSSESPIVIQNAENVTIELVGTNTLTDGKERTDTELNGVLYSTSDLEIKGEGTLVIHANYEDGIVSKDGLTLTSGTYEITSSDDGIRGKDYVEIVDGNYTITSSGDSIKSTNEEDTSLGYITIHNGTFTLNSMNDGIQAETNLTIKNGVFTITTTGDTSSDISSKGLKASSKITIQNGTYNITSTDDSIHSNGDIEIIDGTFTLDSDDDGIHADGTLTIQNGTISVTNSYEGLEAKDIIINDGTINILASDDGINVTDGTTSTGMMSSGNATLTINGGTIYVDASGDGLDANGSIYIKGGTTIVNGPTSDGDGALDYDGEMVITGGTLLAVGSSGMAQTPSTTSTLYTLSVNFNSSINGIISILDSDGNEVVTFKPSKNIQSFIYASSSLKKGSTYTISYEGTSTNEETNGLYELGGYSGGSTYQSATISSIVTQVGQSNSMNQGGMQGGMNMPNDRNQNNMMPR